MRALAARYPFACSVLGWVFASQAIALLAALLLCRAEWPPRIDPAMLDLAAAVSVAMLVPALVMGIIFARLLRGQQRIARRTEPFHT